MVVRTDTAVAKRVRRLAAELLLANHPADCTGCPVYLNCELQSLMQYLEFTDARIRKRKNFMPVIDSNPLIVHDMVRCILCGRCVRACQDLRGVSVITFVKNGDNYVVGTSNGKSLAEAGCKFCGACVEVCPTGSIRDQMKVFEKYKNKKSALVPCRETCPAGIDIPRYVRFVKQGQVSAATAVVREKVPFPGTLGLVCDHPCEFDCRRGEVSEAVAIRNVKRYATEHGDSASKERGYQKAPTGKRAAVVGAGPAGLTAAYYLAKSGHRVTVFEKQKRPGGQLRVGIPAYRLPRQVVDEEIAHIVSAGVDICCGTEIESVQLLKEEGYDAVLVAVGTNRGIKPSLPGAGLPGVWLSTEFLCKANLDEPISIGKRVVILGGGSVAFDCAGWARRLGANDVTLACLEPPDAMRATVDEIEEALAAGCRLANACIFEEITSEDGNISGVRCSRVTSCTFDENGIPDICVQPDSEFIVPADTVIFAIGQRPALNAAFGVELGRGNRVVVDERDGVTTPAPGIFAAGDAVSGTLSVISAIAGGRKAATVIDRFLGGDGVIDDVLAPVTASDPWIGREEGYAARGRCEAAPEEAARCLQCDLRLELTPTKFWGEYQSARKQPAGS